MPRNDEGVLQLLRGVFLELLSDRHELGALDDLRVHNVGDNGLILARQVFIEKVSELVARDRLSLVSWFCLGHVSASVK